MSSASLETKISDFLQLMQQAYQREQLQDGHEDCTSSSQIEKCAKCASAICQMVRLSNDGLECWLTYCENPGMIYRYWFSGKVMQELLNKSHS